MPYYLNLAPLCPILQVSRAGIQTTWVRTEVPRLSRNRIGLVTAELLRQKSGMLTDTQVRKLQSPEIKISSFLTAVIT